ncbi:gastrula zinc finger protein XlCGF8.2DB-like [Syngnathoides biaculeatus]|uniref:gastrula zinc finger protein XlCGF8.2DB-like n=1 Tax=Syngnathoides biaculeatus TaxID=300417 RepID=UPI002ADDD178|nr:gastrula zinc finger protein XlCGF8.2DB-like [Syngnathoides biaculeatus]XP_061664439.1 gastrula zinc finger protein XlCGF8.2DB-like [Syngnathoides biaculeatus]
MCARRAAAYEERLCGPKEEKEPRPQLLDAVFSLQPRIVRRRDVCERLGPERQAPRFLHVKAEVDGKELSRVQEEAESEPPRVKEEPALSGVKRDEEEEEDTTTLPSTGVHLKSEDDGQSGKSGGPELPSGSSRHHMTTGSDRQADGLFPPLSDSDDPSHSPDCHDSKRWKCFQCGKTFPYKSRVKQHMRIHTGEKPFACPICGKRIASRQRLALHTRIHTGEKPFVCSLCGKGFSDKGYLRRHTKVHTGEKPFACSHCGKRFSHKGHMRIHTRIHTGEKPFSCTVCGQRFSDKAILKGHAVTHTGEKPFSCSVCGQRFSDSGNHARHMKTHAGVKPFSCSACGQGFSRRYEVKTHNCVVR